MLGYRRHLHYASIAPLIATPCSAPAARCLRARSLTLPMTGAALAEVAQQGTADYLTGAITLAALSGIMHVGLSSGAAGFPSQFRLTVVSAFITASALIIALSQVRHVLGIEEGDNLFELAHAISMQSNDANFYTVLIGIATLSFLFVVRIQCQCAAESRSVARAAELAARSAPVMSVIATILLTVRFELEALGVAIVGEIPDGLPSFAPPVFPLKLIEMLSSQLR